ncbi:hypothetical protein DNFV4_04369 [Nitrospira tepida]|uniref:Uncharacterized protein n=1 Tax=Nitrospira tepida TaxID=2973512 RepID=A0AA86N3H4_9BACT|nr:outer membrane beta-barrel protein [Nitrospira tepida]CAI4033927.1 hypothetical protein DNFV4_04369 [Nitrospira tepida]
MMPTTSRWSAVGRLITLVLVLDAILPPMARAEWSLNAGQKVSYTTDAFQFSASRRLALSEDPTQPTIVPLEKPQDVVWEPMVEAVRTSSNRWGANELSMKAVGFIFTDKPIFNHGEYRIQGRQWLNDSTSLLFRYRYVPNLFLGPNFERRSGQRAIQEERVTSHRWRMEVEHRLTERWTATLIGRFGLRFYNDAFAERDTHFYAAGPQVSYRAASWATVALGYLYERGLAEGRDEPQFQDDVSYVLHLLSAGVEFRLLPKLTLSLMYLHLRKDFTSGIAGDPHVGRFDQTHQGWAELRYHLSSRAALTASFQRTQRTSTNIDRDFQDSIFSIGGLYQF